MKSSTAEITPIIGTSMGGGFYVGRIRVGEEVFALIVAPKAEGETSMPWNESSKSVAGALSYMDGMANTKAMADAGSNLAKWALDLRIGDADDWYIPAQDELEIIYRNLKPTVETNTLYGRSGVNASAATPTHAYSAKIPAQTPSEAFQAGSSEAMEDEWYWSSTQHAGSTDFAWGQGFLYGNQDYDDKSASGRARAVRRLPI